MSDDALIRSFRRKPLAVASQLPVQLDYGQSAIESVIPHREPFLLLDKLTALDRDAGLIAGKRSIPRDLPLFRGHFPDHPVYPGVLQIEMIGQLGLCLYHFITRKTDIIEGPYPALAVLATRVGGAYYLKPVLPGDEVEILAKVVEYDDFAGTVMGQILKNGEVCCVASGDVTFLD